jgi:hypothetical protein
VTAQPRAATRSSAKYGCVACEDFGTIVGEGSQGTVLCTAEGCAAAERLKRRNDQSAATDEAPVSGRALESAQ